MAFTDPDGRSQMTIESLHDRVLDSDIQYLIRTKAGQLTRANGFRRGDRDDLEQELTLRLLERLKAYDPKKASFYCFALVVLDRSASTIIEARTAACRDTSTTLSLQMPDPTAEGDLTPLSQLVGPADRSNRVGRWTLPEDELREVVFDVRSVLESLPPDLRRMARDLATAKRSEIIRRSGEATSRVRDRFHRLRAAFVQAGLGNDEFAARN